MASETSKILSSELLYPYPSTADLKQQYVGKQIKNVQPPAAIIDVAIVKRNCRLMLEAAKKLELGFRAHVKTHKVAKPLREPFSNCTDAFL